MNDFAWDHPIVFGIIVLVLFVIGTYFFIFIPMSLYGNNLCLNKFGRGWEYRFSSYNPPVCVNEKGEAKYL